MGYRARAVGFGTECEATKTEIAALRARFLARSKMNAEESVSAVSARFEAQTQQEEETGMEERRAELTVKIAELQNLTAKWRKRGEGQRAGTRRRAGGRLSSAGWMRNLGSTSPTCWLVHARAATGPNGTVQLVLYGTARRRRPFAVQCSVVQCSIRA